MSLSTCLGRFTPEKATDLAIAYVESLGEVGGLPLGDASPRKAG